MGKKKDKLAKQQAAAAAAGGGAAPAKVPVPWKTIDTNPLQFLVGPKSAADFLANTWEQAPAYFPATPERAALFSGLLDLRALLAWLRRRQEREGPLEFELDVNAARYVDGERETLRGQFADADTLEHLYTKERCTLQVLQPQRWDDTAWRLVAALERQLGGLVGANIYLTPPGAQGLAPHHDDIDAFVVQTAGKKAWRLYRPLGGFALPSGPSDDLPQELIGEPIMEVMLTPGDVLYMPRGTVHQAVAEADSEGDGTGSAHVTLSTGQRSSWADLAQHVIAAAAAATWQEEPECLPLAMRRGPPPGSLLEHSLHMLAGPPPAPAATNKKAAAAAAPAAATASGLAGALRALADRLEAVPDLVSGGVHDFMHDFLVHRLRPHPAQLPGQGPAPELGDHVWFRAAGWSYLLPAQLTPPDDEDSSSEEEEESEEEDGEGEEGGSGSGQEEEEEQQQQQEEGGGGKKEKQKGKAKGKGGTGSGAPEVTSEDLEAALGMREGGEGGGSRGEVDEGEEDSEEEDSEEEGEREECVKLVTCLTNSRERHMLRPLMPMGHGGGAWASDGEEGAVSNGSEEDGEGEEEEGKATGTGAEDKEATGKSKGKGKHHHHHHHKGGACCSHGHGHGHGGAEGGSSEDLSDLEEGESPGAASPPHLPGVVFPLGALPALVQIMHADSPSKAILVSDLDLEHEADRLRVAFTLWAEGCLCTLRGSKKQQPAAAPAAVGSGKKHKQSDGDGKREQGGKLAKKAKV